MDSVNWKKVFILLIVYFIVFGLIFKFTVKSKEDVNVSFPQSSYSLGEKKDVESEIENFNFEVNDNKYGRYYTEGGFWLSNYTDFVEIPNQADITISAKVQVTEPDADYKDNMERLAFCISTVSGENRIEGDYLQYNILAVFRQIKSGKESVLQLSNREKKTNKVIRTTQIFRDFQEPYDLTINMTRNNGEFKIKIYLDDVRVIENTLIFKDSSKLNDNMYIAFGGANCDITDLNVESETNVYGIGIYILLVAIIAGAIVALKVGNTIGMNETQDAYDTAERIYAKVAVFPLFYIIMQLSQLITPQWAIAVNNFMKQYYAINIFPNFPIYIPIPLIGESWFIPTLVILIGLLAFLLYRLEVDGIKAVLQRLLQICFYMIFFAIFLFMTNAIINEVLLLGILFLAFGIFGAFASSVTAPSFVTTKEEKTVEPENKTKVWVENGLGKEYLKVSSDGKRYLDKDGSWKNVNDIDKR